MNDKITIDGEAEEVKEEVLVNNELEGVENRLQESGVLTKDLIDEVKKLVAAEVIADLKEDNALAAKELEIKRELEGIEHANYVALKMESDDPWVEIVGDITSEDKGHRIELNWNPAFVLYLRRNGISATTEEESVQKYVALLLQDLVDKDEERFGSDYE